jgi:hypothetical protein
MVLLLSMVVDYFVHEKAICEFRNIGSGTRIWAFAHVLLLSTLEEVRLIPECGDERTPAAKATKTRAGASAQLRVVLWAEVCHRRFLPVAPQVFDGIEFGCTGSHVHRFVAYPAPSGPDSRMSSKRSISSSLNRGFRPARPALRNASTPVKSRSMAHRLTDCRCTPTRRSTSDCETPAPRSFAAFSRRRSNFFEIALHSTWIAHAKI